MLQSPALRKADGGSLSGASGWGGHVILPAARPEKSSDCSRHSDAQYSVTRLSPSLHGDVKSVLTVSHSDPISTGVAVCLENGLFGA